MPRAGVAMRPGPGSEAAPLGRLVTGSAQLSTAIPSVSTSFRPVLRIHRCCVQDGLWGVLVPFRTIPPYPTASRPSWGFLWALRFLT